MTRMTINLPTDLDPDGLVTIPPVMLDGDTIAAPTADQRHAFDDVAGVQHDDGVTAVALIDLARHVVADYADTDPDPQESSTTVYTLAHGADYELSVTVFPTHRALWEQIKSDAEEAAERVGEPIPNDPEDWPAFIQANAWKVTDYFWEASTITPATTDERFDMTPAPRIVCACGAPIRHDELDPAESWTDPHGQYACPATNGEADHKPAENTETVGA